MTMKKSIWVLYFTSLVQHVIQIIVSDMFVLSLYQLHLVNKFLGTSLFRDTNIVGFVEISCLFVVLLRKFVLLVVLIPVIVS